MAQPLHLSLSPASLTPTWKHKPWLRLMIEEPIVLNWKSDWPKDFFRFERTHNWPIVFSLAQKGPWSPAANSDLGTQTSDQPHKSGKNKIKKTQAKTVLSRAEAIASWASRYLFRSFLSFTWNMTRISSGSTKRSGSSIGRPMAGLCSPTGMGQMKWRRR